MSQLSLSGRIVEQLELNENFSSQRKRFLAAGADSQLIDAAFQQFKQLKDKGLLSLEQKDIDRYSTLEELQQVIDSLSGVKTKTEVKKLQKVTGAERVWGYEGWTVYHITTEEAAKLLGKGTKWCISAEKDNRFDEYADDSTIYFAMSESGAKYAVVVRNRDNKRRVYDEEDRLQSPSFVPGGIPESVFKYEEPKPPDIATRSVHALYSYALDNNKRWPEAEAKILTDVDVALRYAKFVIKGRWPEAEAEMLKSPRTAFMYAADVIKGRWPEAEDVIAKSAEYSFQYAFDVLSARFPAGEDVIRADNRYAQMYSRIFARG